MPVRSNACEECGVPLAVGLAQCPNCGARTGTVFSESSPSPDLTRFSTRRKATGVDIRHQVEKAREGASNALYLALASFVPLLGLPLAVAAIVFAVRAERTLASYNIEEGRGSAMAGIIVGALGILAQVSYGVYAWRTGFSAILGG
jgi:uncharacterized Zn finger protein (UPF0148 family)